MFSILFIVIFSLVLVLALKAVSLLLSERLILSREELSCYECGFDPNSLSRIPFSLRYFLLTLVFLLFDLEVVLMLFVPYLFGASFYSYGVFVVMTFLFILLVGLVYEWHSGALD